MLDQIPLNQAALRALLRFYLFEMADSLSIGVDDSSAKNFEKSNSLHYFPPGIRDMNFADNQCSHASACVSSARKSR
jgi:hypothetical protein